jgi:hypothetical protein
MKFFQNKLVHLAIGAGFCIALTLVAIKWLFSDSLQFTAAEIEDGKTGSAVAMLPLIFDVAVGSMIWIGSTIVMVIGWVATRTKQLLNDDAQPAPATTLAATATGKLTTQSDSQALQRVVLDLGNAVAINDLTTAAKLQRQLRFPFALSEMQEAYAAGDLERGKSLAAEVERLISADSIGETKGESVVEQTVVRTAKRGAK